MTTAIISVIDRMKRDYSFRMSVLSSQSIEERLEICNHAGFPITQHDFSVLTFSTKHQPTTHRENLANTWLFKGPCHTKCAPIVIED